MGRRIFYCPKHGRVTEEEYEERSVYDYFCEQCDAWYFRLARKSMKKNGET